jgi:hypothetical protein
MNTIERIGWATAGRPEVGGVGGTSASRQAPLEVLIVAIAIGGQVLAALTHPIAGAALTIVVATVVTLRRMRAEVRALRAWETGSDA